MRRAPNRLNPDGYKKLAKLGLLDKRLNIVHGNYLTDDELKIVIDSGASVTITRKSKSRWATARVNRPRARFGWETVLGVDVDLIFPGMFTVAYGASASEDDDNQKVAKATKAPAQIVHQPREALQWATIDSARALGLGKKVGSLKPGKQADIVMLNGKDLNLFPVNNPIENVVFHAHGGNVDTVMMRARSPSRMAN